MKIILAGSYQEYREALIEFGLTEKEAIYGHSIERMAGIEADEVIITGKFYGLKNDRELKDFADNRIRK